MRVLVVYASRYGATRGIAERITAALNERGHRAAMVTAGNTASVEEYDAFVVGSAVFIGRWMKEASEFVRRNSAALADKPVWLFSSGPIGQSTEEEKVL